MKEEEIITRIVRRLVEEYPDILEHAIVESGVVEEMVAITEGYQSGSGGRT